MCHVHDCQSGIDPQEHCLHLGNIDTFSSEISCQSHNLSHGSTRAIVAERRWGWTFDHNPSQKMQGHVKAGDSLCPFLLDQFEADFFNPGRIYIGVTFFGLSHEAADRLVLARLNLRDNLGVAGHKFPA